jgi:type VI secretion system secreted protein Hcp
MATRIFLSLSQGGGDPVDLSKAIEIQSFSWGVVNDASTGSGTGGGGTGKARLQPLTVVKRPDAASAALFAAVAIGDHFAKANVMVVSSGGTLRYEFGLVLPSGFVTQGSQGEQPLEEVTFQFAEVSLK